MLGCRHRDAVGIRKRGDEALAVGEQIRCLVVEARITAGVEVAPLGQHHAEADRERAGRDNPEPDREGARRSRRRGRIGDRCRVSSRHSADR